MPPVSIEMTNECLIILIKEVIRESTCVANVKDLLATTPDKHSVFEPK
jgi:hypothetical protein